MMMRGALFCVFIVLALPYATAKDGEPRFFNVEEFAGLVSKELRTYEDAVLDIDLDSPAGAPIHFDHCKKVAATSEQQIDPSQFSLFKLLSINCLAAQRFIGSKPSSASYFPKSWSRAMLKKLPANAVPRIGENDDAKRSGKDLGSYERRAAFSIRKDGTAAVQSATDDIVYVIMARADFDADGIEDLLVRADWSARRGSGRGSDLFLLSKTSPSAPIKLTWRS